MRHEHGLSIRRDRLRYTDENCRIKAALDIVGEKWSLLVLREAFFGLRRFDDFQRAIGCARNLLSERLAKLVEHGVLARVEYQEPGQRRRHEYHLTEKGLDLQPALVALMQWGDRWERRRRRPARRVPAPRVRRAGQRGARVRGESSALARSDTRRCRAPARGSLRPSSWSRCPNSGSALQQW